MELELTEGEIKKKVSKCSTLDELAQVIESLADHRGQIRGLTKTFSAQKMAKYCRGFEMYPETTLTRNWGIRDRAIDIIGDV